MYEKKQLLLTVNWLRL